MTIGLRHAASPRSAVPCAVNRVRVYRLLRDSTVVVVGDVTRVARSHGC